LRDQRRIDLLRERLAVPLIRAKKLDRARRAIADSLKASLPISLSLVAFVLSAVNSYYTVIRVEDNISMNYGAPPFISRQGDNILVDGALSDIVCINSGNRAAAVTSFTLIVKIDSDCSSSDWSSPTYFQTDLVPFVVKEREVTLKKIALLDPPQNPGAQLKKVADGRFSFPLEKSLLEKESVLAHICARVTMVTPSIADYVTIEELEERYVYKDGSFDLGYYSPSWRKPTVLIHETRTVFPWSP
jgi:hypothetical protein